MKLQRLAVKDFLGLTEADIDLGRPVNLIIGRNGAGKSSVRDAILYALTGRCRSTDAGGRGADSLIRRGATGCSVRLEYDANLASGDLQGMVIERGRNGAGPTGVKGLCPDLAERGLSADLVEALLDMPHLLRLSAKERSAILSQVISPAVSLEDVQRHATAMRLSDDAIGSLLVGLRRVSPGPYGPAELAQAYKLCYEARTKRKRDLADVEGKLQAMPAASGGPLWADTVRQRLQLIEADEADLREKIGALRQQQAEWNRAQARRQDLERQVAELESRSRQPQQALPMGPSVEDLTAQVAEFRENYRAASTLEDREREKRVSAESKASAAEGLVRQARSGDTSCPAHVTTDPCPVLEQRVEERKAQVPQLEADARRTAAAVKRARTGEIAAAAEADKARIVVEHLEAELAAAREGAARNQGSAEASLDALQAELDRIEADYSIESDEVTCAELHTSGKILSDIAAKKALAQEELRGIEAAARSAEERKKLEAEVAAARKVVATLEELVPALEPRGLPARILAERIGPFEARINEQLATITGGEYRVAIRAERGVDVDVFRDGSGLALPCENLSTSERMRLGVALAAGISVLSGLRILVIDEAELLDVGNRGLLMRGVMELAGEIETTLILATCDRPTAATSDAIGVHWVADGRVTPVVATEAVGAAR